MKNRVQPFSAVFAREILVSLLALFAIHASAQTGPSNLNISGILYQPSGDFVSQASVNFRLEIWDKGSTCILYSEDHLAQNLSNTKGAFSLPIGKGTSPSNFVESSSSFTTKLFENSGTVAGGWPNCPSGTTLNSGDERVVRISYDLGAGLVAMSPDVPIASSAFAMVADTLQGKRPTDFVQLKDDATYDLNQANVENVFSAVNYARLQQLLSPSAAIGFGSQRLTSVADPTAAQDAATKNYSDTRLAGQTIDLQDVAPGFGGGKVLTWDQAQSKWVAQAPTIAGSAGGDLTGTYPNPTIAANAIGTSKISNNAITSAKINSTGAAANRLLITDATTGATVTYATCANDEVLKYVTGTGWQCATVSSLSAVTSVAGKTGAVTLNALDISGLGTAAIHNVGVGATEIPQLNGSGKLANSVIPAFLGDVTGAVDANIVVALQGRPVASTAPNANEVLRWNGSRWEPQALTDNGITALTGDISASGNGSVAATLTNGVVTTPKMFANPGVNRLVATDNSSGGTLVPFVCNLNETMQWTAGGWACTTVSNLLGTQFIVDGGNARGANISIGTTDNFALTLKTNNSDRLTILNTGSIGIGTTSPNNLLDVSSSGTSGPAIQITSTDTGGRAYALKSTGSAASAGVGKLAFRDITAGADRMVIDSSGYVGIGTTTPSAPLNVQNTDGTGLGLRVSRAGGATVDIQTSAGNGWIGTVSNDRLNFFTNNSAARMVLDTGGNVGIGTVSPARSLHLSNAAPLRIGTATDYFDFLQTGANLWGFLGSGGSYGLTMESATGKVGVGVNNPTAVLDLKGAADTSGQISLQLRSGNSQSNFSSNQMTFGYGGVDSYRHAIKTRHNAAAAAGNAFDFYTWNYGTDTAAAIGTKPVMTIDGTGSVGIGTTTPGYTLDVNGAINGTSLKINGTDISSSASAWSVSGGNVYRSSGNVGIGTTSPAYPLTVNGQTGLYGTTTINYSNTGQLSYPFAGTPAGQLVIINNNETTPADNSFAGVAFSAMNTGGFNQIGYIGAVSVAGGSNRTPAIVIGQRVGGSSSERIRIDGSGNVGIGTISPGSTFQVKGNYEAFIEAAGTHGITFYPNYGGFNQIYSDYWTGSSTLPLSLGTYGNLNTLVVKSGNVGIGTTSPARLLHVNGPMRVTASALPGTPATGDIAVDSGDANKLKWYNGSGWQEAGGGSGGGRTSCPAGFTLIGTSGSAEAFCISSNQETSATWLGANQTCRGKTPKARLCSASEWAAACVDGASGPNNMTGHWEWVADLSSGDGQVMGNAGCDSFVASSVNFSSFGSRCCFR